MSETIVMPQVAATLNKYDIKYEVLTCDPDFADTAAFCDAYGFTLAQAANTIIVASKKVEPIKYAVCVVRGDMRLDVNKRVRQIMEVKRASFADAETTKQLTGMMIGGVTAIGTKNMPIYIDAAVFEQEKVVLGGGNRSSKVVLNPKELLKLPQVAVVKDLAKYPSPPQA